MNIAIIGIDCATVDKRIGLAWAQVLGDDVQVLAARACDSENRPATLIAAWLKEAMNSPTLLAIDAPLGWPRDLSVELAEHRAGCTIQTEPRLMFRRETDRYVYARLKKAPLEVGADRIARTAHFALKLLGDVRRVSGQEIPLAWDPNCELTAAIEVYPAATLIGRGLTAKGYKKSRQFAVRKELVANLGKHADLAAASVRMIENADVLDAVVCTIAGADFVRGLAAPPSDRKLAEREGWIWFARK